MNEDDVRRGMKAAKELHPEVYARLVAYDYPRVEAVLREVKALFGDEAENYLLHQPLKK